MKNPAIPSGTVHIIGMPRFLYRSESQPMMIERIAAETWKNVSVSWHTSTRWRSNTYIGTDREELCFFI